MGLRLSHAAAQPLDAGVAPKLRACGFMPTAPKRVWMSDLALIKTGVRAYVKAPGSRV